LRPFDTGLNADRSTAKARSPPQAMPPEADVVPLKKTQAFQGFRNGDNQFKECDRTRMQIIVRDNNVEQALRALKKKLQREGVYREMKLRRHYEKPSEKRARERAAAIRRARKLERKRAEREGAR
jgi:small subunit ribosomal protein S21